MSADRSVTIRLKVASEQYDAAMARAGMEVKALAAEVDNAGRSAGSLAKIEQASNRVADAQAKVAAGSKTLTGLRVQEEAATRKLADAEASRAKAAAAGDDNALAKAARARANAESELTAVIGKREQAETSLAKSERDLSLAQNRLAGEQAGTEYLGAFESAIRGKLAAALKSLPQAEITADPSEAERRIAEVRAELLDLSGKRIGVDIDVQDAQAKLAAIKAELQALEGDTASDAERRMAQVRAELLDLSGQRIGVDLDVDAAQAKLAAIKAELQALTGKDHNVRIRTDAQSALTQVNSVQRALSGLADEARSAGGGPGAPSAMMLAIAAAALIAGPAVGAATAAVVGLAAAGGTAYAVFKGFQQEMKDGTPVGLQLQGALQGVGGELNHLEEIAANAASGGVLATIDKLHAAIPGLEPAIASLAAHLGAALNIATPGVISIAKQLGPILSDAGIDAEHLARDFTAFANSPQFHQFVEYARSELPIVGHDLADLVKTGIDLGTALQPAGDALLRIVDDGARALDVLARIASWSMPKSQQTPPTAGASGTGPGYHSGGSKPDLLHRINDTIINGAQDFLTGDQSDPGGYLKRAAQQKTAAQQSAAAQEKIKSAAQAAADAALQQSVAQDQANVALSAGYTQASAFATADRSANQAIDQQAISLAAATRQMYLQSDAGGLLKQQLDLLSGKQLNAAQAQNQFEQGLVNLVKHTTAADAAVSGMSSSAIKNRGDLLSLVQSAESAAEAYGSMDKSGAKTRQRLVDLRKEIIDNAVANGENRAEVTKFIDSVLKVPARVPPTKLDVDTAAAQQKLAALNNTLGHMVGPTLTVHAEVDGALANIRSVVEYAANQTAVIHVTTSTRSGAVSGGRQVLDTPAHAAGGGVADGWFTAGEQGWELGYKSGSNVQFFPHPQSTAMLPGGPSVAAYAGGTGLVTITPSKSKAKAAKSKASTAAQARLNAVMAVQFKVDNTDLDRLHTAITGSAAQIRSAVASLISDVHNAALKGLGSESVIPQLRRGASELESYANRKAAVVTKLKAANGQLAAAEKLWADEQKSTAAAVMGTFDAGTSGNGTYGSLMGVLGQKIGQAQRFATDVKSLTGRLNKAALAQIESEGPDQAGANLHALAGASPAQLAAYNAKYTQLQTLAQQVGTNSADSLYKAGVDAAKGLVRGLESQQAAISRAMSKIAASLVAQIKHDLKISSPSRVAHELFAHVGGGAVTGLLSQEALVGAAGSRLAHAAVVSPGQLAFARPVPHSSVAGQPIDYARLGRSVAEAMQSIPVTGELHGDGAGLSVSVSKRSSRGVQ